MEKSQAYEFLCRLAEGISCMFGGNCETVIHEIDGQQLKNLAFYNGHVTGRRAGSTLSIYGRDTADEDDGGTNLDLDYLNQMVMVSGKQIKSTTIHMRGEDYHYALGINFDVTAIGSMRLVLDGLAAVDGELLDRMRGSGQAEIDELFDSCMKTLNCPVNLMKKADRMQLVRLLREQGVFHIQRSVPYVAKRLGVSKYTIYNYLNQLG